MNSVWLSAEMGATSGPGDPVLELTDATVVINGVRALDRVTLTIRAGEHTAILGPNGSGKTALISLLTCDRYPMAGAGGAAVRVFGNDRWNVSELRSSLGVVTADLHQQFVAGNCAGAIRGEDAVVSGLVATRGFLVGFDVTPAMRRQAFEALARLEAAHLAGKRLDEMSTGEARRVLIARALVSRPRALVLDEPTAGLDVAARFRFLAAVRRIAREGVTIVLVTHHVEEIVHEIDRVVLLQRGRVVDDGPKRTLLTSERLSALFEFPITVDRVDGSYHARA